MSGMPGPPGTVVSGVPGEPGITVSAVPGVPGVAGVGRHKVADLNWPNSSGRLVAIARASCCESSVTGDASVMVNCAPLSRRRSLEELTSIVSFMTVDAGCPGFAMGVAGSCTAYPLAKMSVVKWAWMSAWFLK